MDKEYSDKLIEEAKKKNDYLAMFNRALNKPKPAGNSISNPRDYVQGYTDGIIFALYTAHVFGNIPKDDYEKKINDIISAYDKQFEFSETEFHKGEI